MRSKIVNLYVFFILGIYPFLMHNGFIDISKTKSDIFIVATGCVFLTCITCSVLEKDWKWLCKKQNWLIYAAIIVIGISTWCSKYPMYALTGEQGRYQGALVCWGYCIAALCIFNFGSVKKHYIDVMIVTGTLVSFIAILNFYEVDVLGTLGRIKEHLRHAYITTIGNINIYAAYLSVVVPAAIVRVITECNHWKKTGYYICLVVLFGGMIVSSCDSVYITLGMLFIVLPFWCLHEYEKRKRMSEILIIFGMMLFVLSFINQELQYPLEYLDGLNRHFVNPVLACSVFLLFVIVDVLFSITEGFTKNWKKRTWQRGWLIFSVIVGIIVSSVYICNTTFDSNWGSYRGFIWSQGWDFFTKQPIKEKLLGIGLDCVFPIFYRFYGYEGMIVDGFAFYNNLHNEYLQYLITVGIIGLMLYLAAIGISIYHLFQKMKYDTDAFAIFVTALCYLVQAFTNISMCCVTAVIFVLLFAGQKIETKEIDGI